MPNTPVSRTHTEAKPVYVLDTGIAPHHEFEKRVSYGANFVLGEDSNDYYGHGTHIAGIVGAKTLGVAPGVHLISVKILDGSGHGTMTGLLKGLDWIINDIQMRDRVGQAVINLSMGFSVYDAIINRAVVAAQEAGAFMAVAAGNDGLKVYGSPAAEPRACVVGSLESSGRSVSTFSSHGDLVDVYAPGRRILSLAPGNWYIRRSGTSMAAPHVAGIAALLMQHANPANFSAEDVCAQIEEHGVHATLPPFYERISAAQIPAMDAMSCQCAYD